MRIIKSLLQSNKISVPFSHFLLRTFILFIVAFIVLSEAIAMLWNAVDWGLLLGLIPDWLVPDVLQGVAEKLKLPEPIAAPPAGCTAMPDGTQICENDVQFPFGGPGGTQ